MFGIGPGELIVIILVALVVLGPEKLPAAARILGRMSGELRRLSTEFQRTLHEDADPARTAGPARRDEDAEPAPDPAPEPEPDALETANVTPADFTGLADAETGADKVTVGVADTPDDGPVTATSRPEERGRS